MKIFGLNIGFGDKTTSPPVEIKDVTPEVDIVPTGTISPTKVKPVASPVLIYQQNATGSYAKLRQRRNVYEAPEYDLYEISRISDVDSYVRQAFKKQVGLFLKEGFDYVGRNKRAVKYIRTRFAQIAVASSIPHNELIRRLANNFMSKSNAFLIKVRKEEASGGKVRTDINGKRLEPIAAYYPAPPETMEVDTDGSGKPIRWRQRLPNGQINEFKPENVIHFTFDRKEGFLFGTPILVPVIDDIRALRRIEENIELLIYKHLFPIFQYIVGTEDHPAGYTESGKSEIEVVKQEIQNMPSEGGIVTPERHEIRAIGAESKALRAESYLQHFKLRVFSGLGMSAVDFGEASTANKATADNLSRALVDSVKDFQDAFEAQFNEFVIDELLLESSFDDDMMAEENRVQLVFREIDIDKQIKVETHAADQFTKNILTWDEAREMAGRDPVLLPENGEEFEASEYPEWSRTYWKLFHEPEKLISAVDEMYLQWATARSVGTTSTEQDIGATQQAEQDLEKVKAKAKARAAPKRKDAFLNADYEAFRELVQTNAPIIQTGLFRSRIRTLASRMTDKLVANTTAAFLRGLGSDLSSQLTNKVSIVRREIGDRSEMLIRRLTTDIENVLRRRIDMTFTSDRILKEVNAVFDGFRYRLHLIEDVQAVKANNLGRVIRAIHFGVTKGKFITTQDACDECKEKTNKLVELSQYSLDNVLPHHPHCMCSLQAAEVKNG